MNKWIAEFELEDGDTMPEHMDLNYKGAKIDFHCKPLEQEPITKNDLGVDCVSRKEVIDTIFTECTGDKLDIDFAKVLLLQRAIKVLPSVTPQEPIAIIKIKYDEDKLKELVDKAVLTTVIPQESKWIPVTERLPNKDGEYLLFGKINEDEKNYIFVGEYDSCGEQFGIWQEQFDRATLGCLGSEFFEYSSVLAWMPLPKPYEESEGV